MMMLRRVISPVAVQARVMSTSTSGIPSDPETREKLARMLRVDQSGELGADYIYAGQLRVLRDTDVGPTIQHMWDQEKHHLNTFNELLVKHRVRPSVFHPLWAAAGYSVGVASALLGKEAAMALTVNVETVIGEHYNDQLRELHELDPEDKELKDLKETIRQFRDEELEHLDTGLKHDAESTPLYGAVSQLVQGGCRAAIWVASRF